MGIRVTRETVQAGRENRSKIAIHTVLKILWGQVTNYNCSLRSNSSKYFLPDSTIFVSMEGDKNGSPSHKTKEIAKQFAISSFCAARENRTPD